jgi:ribonuclease G
MILSYEKESIDDIELIYNISIEIKSNETYHLEHYEVVPY